jgi:hypothetical protein
MRWGLAFASIYCLWAVVVLFLGGEAAFRKQGITFGEAIGGYLAGGVAAGAVVGLFRPLLERSWGAPVVGMLAAIPVALAFEVATQGARWMSFDSLLTAGIFSLTVGTMGGLVSREVMVKRRKR